jgi:adenosylcobinamide-phosphate synthase
MSSGAGALGVQLGGAAIYHGEVEHRPTLGDGPPAVGADIHRAWQLVARTTVLWLAVACVAAVLMEAAHA